MPLGFKRYFYLHEAEIQQLLVCDNSDTEDALVLDEEDIGFLESHITAVEERKDGVESDPVEVIIELPKEANCQSCYNKSSDHPAMPTSSLPENLSFVWKKNQSITK